MALVKKSITVTDRQEQSARFHALKEAIRDGLESGVSDKTARDVWAEAERRALARHVVGRVLRPSRHRSQQ